METESRRFHLVAGHLALDFANTLDDRYIPERTAELLASYGDLLSFCEQSEILTAHETNHLLLRSADATGSAAALQGALELREAIYWLFSAAAQQLSATAEDLAILNRHLASALAHRRIAEQNGAFVWNWSGLDGALDAPLWPIAYAAAELLVSGELAFVHECEQPTCRWLFLDQSKNHRRRWCDMKLCGNRLKARNYYRKHGQNRSEG